jgi:plasmid stability protein
MSDLLIRNVAPYMKREIQKRARARGRSLSDEAKILIQRALLQPEDRRKLGTEMFNMIRPEDRGDDLVFELPDDISEPPDFK